MTFGTSTKPKTRRSARTIPIGTETAEIFCWHSVLPLLSTNDLTSIRYIAEGLPLHRWNLLRKHLKPVAKKLGASWCHVLWHHSAKRHASHATMLDGVGTPEVGTMQSLIWDHATPEITREIYLHAIPEEQRRAV